MKNNKHLITKYLLLRGYKSHYYFCYNRGFELLSINIDGFDIDCFVTKVFDDIIDVFKHVDKFIIIYKDVIEKIRINNEK